MSGAYDYDGMVVIDNFRARIDDSNDETNGPIDDMNPERNTRFGIEAQERDLGIKMPNEKPNFKRVSNLA